MDIIPIIIGGATLLFGRVLYWLFVGVVGYYLGFELASFFLTAETALITLIAIITAIIGVALAFVVKYMASGLTGFIVGGYLFNQITVVLDFNAGNLGWVIFLVGGILGVLLINFFYDWGIIVLSSFTGALLIMSGLSIEEGIKYWIFGGLVLLGLLVQGVILFIRKPEHKELPG